MNQINVVRKMKNLLLRVRKKPQVNEHCTEFEVNNWVISDFIVRKLLPVVGIHPFPIHEIQMMVAAVCRLKPSHIFEWGTHIGKSARIFYETSRYFKINTEIHSIDLPDDVTHNEHPGKKRGYMVRNINAVKLHQGDGLDISMDLISKKDDVKNPLFFLDGDHSYETVGNECRTIIEKVATANILLHDTFYQSPESGYNIGPHLVITEILSEFPEKFKKVSCDFGLPGMTLLYQNKFE